MHCHNDLGMAVANSLAGGADRRRAPGRVHDQRPRRARRQRLARGDRDGGAHAPGLLQPATSASTRRRSCRRRGWSSQITGFVVQPNKAVVGANAFAHASGIHQDGVLKARDTYEIMRAEDVGWSANKIVLGKLSGRNAFKQRLKELGIELESRGRRQRRVPALQGPRRQEERDLRRGPAGAGRATRRDAPSSEHYRLVVADRSTRETGERPHAQRRVHGRRRGSARPSRRATARSTRLQGDRDAGRRAAPSCCSIRSTPSPRAPNRRAR